MALHIASQSDRIRYAAHDAWQGQRLEAIGAVLSGIAGALKPIEAWGPFWSASAYALVVYVAILILRFAYSLWGSPSRLAVEQYGDLEASYARLYAQNKEIVRERDELRKQVANFLDLTPEIHGIAVSDERQLGGPDEFDLLVDITTKESTAFNDNWLLDLSWGTGRRVEGLRGRVAIAHQFPVGRMPLTVTFPHTGISGGIPHIREARLERLIGTDHRGRRITFERTDTASRQLARVPESVTSVDFSRDLRHAPEPDDDVVCAMLGIRNTGPTDDFQIQVVSVGRRNGPIAALNQPCTLRWDGSDGSTTRRIVAGMTDAIELARFYRTNPPPEFSELRGIAYLDTPWCESTGAHPYVDMDTFTAQVWTIEIAVAAASASAPRRQWISFHIFWKAADDPTGKTERIGWGSPRVPIMRMLLLKGRPTLSTEADAS
jgi:hypothetical protein